MYSEVISFAKGCSPSIWNSLMDMLCRINSTVCMGQEWPILDVLLMTAPSRYFVASF